MQKRTCGKVKQASLSVLKLARLIDHSPGFLSGRAAIAFRTTGQTTARLAAGYEHSARNAYGKCGAVALAGPVRDAASGSLQSGPNVERLAGHGAASQADSDSLRSMSDAELPLVQEIAINGGGNLQQKIGLESILRTSVLLASETDGEGLIRRVLTVLLQVCVLTSSSAESRETCETF